MTKIKFCGMTRPEDAELAEQLRANFVGVILTTSPRKVTAEQALRVFDAAPSLRHVGVVGASGKASTIGRTARTLELDVIQLHGTFTPDEMSRLRDEFDGEIWAVAPVEDASGVIGEDWHSLTDAADGLLLDTSVKGRTGGTGVPFNWSSAKDQVHKISREIPVILAGGLDPQNVAEAIKTLKPAVVDVSSGVEASAGVKDPDLMLAFANAVRSASIV